MDFKILLTIYFSLHIHVNAQRESAYIEKFNDSACSFDFLRSRLVQEYKEPEYKYIMDVVSKTVTELNFYER